LLGDVYEVFVLLLDHFGMLLGFLGEGLVLVGVVLEELV
jgi:hypothetical protein